MTLKHFIERPVLASVISILIVIAGLIGLATLPVEQYPDIAPPTVMVRATYPGASAETVQKSVIVPLEQAINGVEDMMYMTSTATNTGTASITIYFSQGTDADMAGVQDGEVDNPLQSRRQLRCQLPHQLYENQHRAADFAHSGRGRGEHFQRRVCYANMA